MNVNKTNSVEAEEVDRFEQAVQTFLQGDMDADRFQAVRLQQGVYGQRQDGVNMVRIKVPGGSLAPAQLVAVAEALEDYVPEGKAHVTTRQDIQIHYVPLKDTPTVLRHLSQAGLTTREACGNTVRNVTACPLAGVCQREHVDVTPFLQGVVDYFLRHPLTQNLPRKFKISISGCEADCAQGMLHDVGIVAVRSDDGRFGFKVLAGGGLGHKPHEAIVVEPFVEEKDLLPVVEAIVVLHNRYSDRTKRAKSRIKFLVDRFGADGFVAKYREELGRTRAALAAHSYPKGQWQGGESGDTPGPGAPRRLFKQKQPGLYVFPMSVPLGQLDAGQLRGIAALMEDLGLSDVRTTQDQNLMLVNVPEPLLSAVSARLGTLRLHVPRRGDDVVACPGTSTCRLGITSSMTVAPKLVGGNRDLRIRVSGCHNGCAQPETGDIGIFGEGRRMHGKLIPHYQMYFGGNGCGGGGFAIKGPSVPAARIEKAVERVREGYTGSSESWESFFEWARKRDPGYFERLLADLVRVSEADLAQVAKDHGYREDFKVLQLGGGECAGAVQDTVAAKFSEAAYERDCRNAFAAQRKYQEALECAEAMARLVSQALAFLSGQDHRVSDLAEILNRLRSEHSAFQPLAEKLDGVVERLTQLRSAFDDKAFATVATEIDAWMKEAEQACALADSRLNLPGVSSRPLLEASGVAASINVSADPCPINFIKAKLELDKLAGGEVLALEVSSGQAVWLVPSSLESIGHSVLSRQKKGDITLILVRKAGD
jgi:sulfite reductase beta subunit-like hemoprotein/TusA-related sulfurtransferase